jgi:hypothetical protein
MLFNPLESELVEIFNNSVCTSKKTPHFIKKNYLLMLFKEIIAVHIDSENRIKQGFKVLIAITPLLFFDLFCFKVTDLHFGECGAVTWLLVHFVSPLPLPPTLSRQTVSRYPLLDGSTEAVDLPVRLHWVAVIKRTVNFTAAK